MEGSENGIPPQSGKKITIQQALQHALGRSMVIGEHHNDRAARDAVLKLIRQAHQAGYRTLGVEISRKGFRKGKHYLSGLAYEMKYIRELAPGERLGPHDIHSVLGPQKKGGKRPRMNRLWHIRQALNLGWKVIPIDPHHWNWRQGTVDGYLHSREPAMAETIQAHPLILAIVGSAHLGGLHGYLGEEKVFFLNSSPVKPEAKYEDPIYVERDKFAGQLPLLAV